MPELGKWTTKDPLSLYAGLNVYTFCINNPIALVDVYGLCSMKDLADFMRNKMANPTRFPWVNKAINAYANGMLASNPFGQAAKTQLGIAFNFIDRHHQNVNAGINNTWATLDAVNLGAGDFIGYTLVLEGSFGIDRASLNTLSTGERWKRGIIGGIQMVGCAIGGAQGLHALRGKFIGANGLGVNPFKGKKPKQIDKMFGRKGFTTKGNNPTMGEGSYINPRTGRKYYIDPGGKYRKGVELPHVDIHRSNSGLPKKKFPLGETLYE